MGTTKPRTKAEAIDGPTVDAAITRLIDDVRTEGVVKLSTLGVRGIPSSARARVAERCRNEGLDVRKGDVRVPVDEQLRVRLGTGAVLPQRTVHQALRATAKEVKAALAKLVASHEAVRLVRGTEVCVARPGGHVLVDLPTLDKLVKELASLVARAKKEKASVIADDVRPLLGRPIERVPSGVDVPRVVARVRAARNDAGLAFVPEVVRAFAGKRDEVHDALRAATREGLLELRPESGLGRLTAADLALCIPGPRGSHLSWARLLEED